MFGSQPTKKQAVSMDLGPISKELTKIEKNIGEQKENESSIREMIKSINVSDCGNDINNNIKKINDILGNPVINSYYKSFDSRLLDLYNCCFLDTNSIYNYINELYSVLGCSKAWDPGYIPIQDRLDNINNKINNINNINNKINNNNPIESVSDKFIVITGNPNFFVSKKRFIYCNMEVYKDYLKIKLLNAFHAQLKDRILILNNNGYRDPIIGKFIEKISNNLDISIEPDVNNDGESFSFELLTQTISGKIQSITMEVPTYDHEFAIVNIELDNSLETDIVILPQEIIFPFKTPVTI